MLRKIRKIIQTVFPMTCIFCGDYTELPRPLCSPCEVDLPWITKGCYKCAYPIESELITLFCAACQIEPNPITRTFALFHYQHPINSLIAKLKFHHQLMFAKLFGDLLTDALKHGYLYDSSYPTVIIPMPLHPKRLRERGFNQALEIARPISKKLNIPIDYRSCERIIHTETQSSLKSPNLRLHNVKNAFLVKPFHANHVLIIDDVMTTGYTARAIASELVKRSVRVDLACCAR